MNKTVRTYCALNGIEISDGEIIIIQNMMRREADENDVSIEYHDDVMAFPERMLDLYFNI